jgi:transcriptional regulator with XRE-family HTH domain
MVLALPRILETGKLMDMTASTGEEQRGPDPAAPERRSIPQDTFPLRLKAVRLHAGNLTIVQAAERAGISNQNWSNWENGRLPRDLRGPVIAISETFGVDQAWLMYGGRLTPEVPVQRRRRSRHTDWPENTSGYSPRQTNRANRPPSHPNGFRRPASTRHPIAA